MPSPLDRMLDDVITQEYEPEKLQELIVYVSDRSAGDRYFGKTKLNKILFFSDFKAFRTRGRSITGAAYQRLPQGPCPHQLLPAIGALGEAIFERQEPTYAGVQKRLVPTRGANLSIFEAEEIAIVDQVLEELRPLTNTQVSDLSHETMSWRLTEDYSEIPYGTALLGSDPPTAEDLAWLEGLTGERLVLAAQ